MASLLYSSGAESGDDDFPAVNELIRRHKAKTASPVKASVTIQDDDDNKENVVAQPPKSIMKPILKMPQRDILSPQKSSIQATPMRRRKLGVGFNGPPVANSLLQPFNDDENIERGCRTARARRVRDESSDTSSSFTSFKSSTRSTIFSLPPPKPRYTQTPGRPRLMIDSDEEDQKARRPKPTPRVKLRQKISKISLIAEDSVLGESVLYKDSTMRSSDHDSSTGLGGHILESESEVELSKSDPDSPTRNKNKTVRSLFAPKEIDSDRSRMSELSKDDQSLLGKEPKRDAETIENRIKSVRLIEPSPVKPKAQPQVSVASGADGLEDAFGKLALFGADKTSTTKAKHEASTEPATTTDEVKADQTPSDEIQVAHCCTPQRATKSKLLISPAKPAQIPSTPWKPENKEFWDPEVNFTWIDRHSPERQASPRKLTLSLEDLTATKQKYTNSPQKRSEKKAFDAIKDDIAKNFLRELDERITDGRLEALAATSGGLKTVWSNTLQTTAGRAHWRCKTTTRTTKHKDGSITSEEERQHEASIELATKVLTNEDDLLNTVAHEFCHLAVFMLDGKPKMAHGKEFKAWGAKCSKVFKDKGITVTTKHSYEIDYKYIWRCAECTCEVHRHTKSVDPQRQRCGRCRGVLLQVKPVPRVKKNSPATVGGVPEKKKLSAWQEFLSAQMAELKTTHKELAFDKKMEIVSGRWKEHKKRAQEQKELQQQLDAQFSQDGQQAADESTALEDDSTGVDYIVESVQALDLSVDGDSNVVDSTVLV